jgi:hypothetical protein
MKHLLLFPLFCAAAAFAQIDDALSESEVRRAKQLFAHYAKKGNELNEPTRFSGEIPSAEYPGDDIDLNRETLLEPESILVMGKDLTIGLERKSMRLTFFKNEKLWGEKHDQAQKTNKERVTSKQPSPSRQFQSRTSKWSVDDALDKAKRYLSHFEVEVPPNYHLTDIAFSKAMDGLWMVRWSASFEGIPFDDFQSNLVPLIAVDFHETDGLLSLAAPPSFPLPKDHKIKIDQDKALLKAFKIAPLVEKTRFYRRSRISGFVVYDVENIRLRVAFPNWLLDPEKASWGAEEKPIVESRVCWVVRFRTRPGSRELADRALQPPVIVVYIDAATGECVGADFS